MSGIKLILKEREEQLTKHGRTVESDKQHNTEYQLVDAATALMESFDTENPDHEIWVKGVADNPPIGWGGEAWVKLVKKPYKERLVYAGALIAAEIDRVS